MNNLSIDAARRTSLLKNIQSGPSARNLSATTNRASPKLKIKKDQLEGPKEARWRQVLAPSLPPPFLRFPFIFLLVFLFPAVWRPASLPLATEPRQDKQAE